MQAADGSVPPEWPAGVRPFQGLRKPPVLPGTHFHEIHFHTIPRGNRALHLPGRNLLSRLQKDAFLHGEAAVLHHKADVERLCVERHEIGQLSRDETAHAAFLMKGARRI